MIGPQVVAAPEPAQAVQEAHVLGNNEQAVDRVRRHKGAGTRLPARLADPLESHLGHDFGAVRVHTDAFAASTASLLKANAFTVGSDLFFGTGMYAPDRLDGRLRIAHELVHTLQQRGTTPPRLGDVRRLEDEAEHTAVTGRTGALMGVGPAIMREPTYPRRTTGDAMVREAERVLDLTRDTSSGDETTRLWSRVGSNFEGSTTAGRLARRVWTNIFLRHFTEPESPPGTESVHSRYLYSHTYGWIDAQHFFGFIDFAEQKLAIAPLVNRLLGGGRDVRSLAFDLATEQGIDIERNQQRARDYVVMGAPPATDAVRLMQVRPPNTPLFRVPQQAVGAATTFLASAAASVLLRGAQGELFGLLDADRQQKFWIDSAKSAWSYEDLVSNQLGIRFFFEHGERINALPALARQAAFLLALTSFFASIDVENDQRRLDRQAAHDRLPPSERYLRPRMTEEIARDRYPDLFQLPASGPVLRRCSCGGTAGPSGECAECRRTRLQRKANGVGPDLAPPIVHSVLRSPGWPLEPGVRDEMEVRFGRDFSHVRVHTDDRAAASAAAVAARAYTLGNDVVFAAGAYAPGASEGRRLLTHELAHVAQQAGPPPPGPIEVGRADAYEERAAENAAARSAAPEPRSSAPVLRRQQTEDAALRRRRLATAKGAHTAVDRLRQALDRGYLFPGESLTAGGDVVDGHAQTITQSARAARLRALMADLQALAGDLDAGQVPAAWFDPDVRVPVRLRVGERHDIVYSVSGNDVWSDVGTAYMHRELDRSQAEGPVKTAFSNVHYIQTAPIPKPVLKTTSPPARPKSPAAKPKPPAQEPKHEEPRHDAELSRTPGTPTGIYILVTDPEHAPLSYHVLTGHEGWQAHGVVLEIRSDEYGYFYWGHGDRKVRLPERP